MNYWLLKSEPGAYSWQQLQKQGRAVWDGVRNYQARNYLKAMKLGDLALFYHSDTEKQVLGICEVVREHYPDPTINDPRWVAVEVSPVEALKKPVTLMAIKSDKRLENIALIKQSRLSVVPLDKKEFYTIVELGNT